jgi:uncharacterized protein (DUF427 family)
MSVRLRDVMMGQLDVLRYEPTDKRVRAVLGDRTVIDSRQALLVWEPKRVVPTYAVPVTDVAADVVPDDTGGAVSPDAASATRAPQLLGRPVYDPSIPFTVHTVDGEPVTIRVPGADRAVAAFRPADPSLAGVVLVDFDGFDEWYDEDERVVSHPRDPFHRVDVLHSSRHVTVAIDGATVAESSTPYLLFEPPLPVRYYFAPEDVTAHLQPSDTHTACAYKGRASYFSVGDHDDVAWTYTEPLRDAAEITGRIAFFNERVDLVVDGERLERPITPWSR